jgi:hypothetical protein
VVESTEVKQHNLHEDKARELEKNSITLAKEEKIAEICIPGKGDHELLTSFEDFLKHGHNFPLSILNTETPVKDNSNQGESTALITPIPSLTPWQHVLIYLVQRLLI